MISALLATVLLLPAGEDPRLEPQPVTVRKRTTFFASCRIHLSGLAALAAFFNWEISRANWGARFRV